MTKVIILKNMGSLCMSVVFIKCICYNLGLTLKIFYDQEGRLSMKLVILAFHG